MTSSTVRIVSLFPELLGTYGDGGNAMVLARRLQWRDIPHEHVTVDATDAIPTSGDIYLVGGGEDGPQTEAARRLRADGGLHTAVERGAVVFAVCAGLQILGHRFPDGTGRDQPGLGLLDCVTIRVDRPRAVGELLTTDATIELDRSTMPLGPLTGFENHAGRTARGESVRSLGAVAVGEGNGDGSEGIVAGRVIGTYLHGPALARNPELADALLSLALGDALTPLTPLDAEIDSEIDALRADRIRAARAHELAPRRSWRDRLRRT